MDPLRFLVLQNPIVLESKLFQSVVEDHLTETRKTDRSKLLLFFSLTDRYEVFVQIIDQLSDDVLVLGVVPLHTEKTMLLLRQHPEEWVARRPLPASPLPVGPSERALICTRFAANTWAAGLVESAPAHPSPLALMRP
jgi:hypothetical protein